MSKLSLLGTSFILVLVLWTFFSWPVPKYISEGIPASSNNMLKDQKGFMIQGDHLQLLYHFWMLEEMVFGDLSWFHHVYEFNTGEDSERFRPNAYFFPFSLLHAVISKIGGAALGWNLTQFASLWLTFLFTFLLIRRYCPEHLWESLLLTLLVLAFPNRWENLLGGSPAGFALAWVPAIFLGLDRAIRDHSQKGGWLAGFGILFACFGDTHVFFFVTLSAPFFCFFSYVYGRSCLVGGAQSKRIAWVPTVLALVPVALMTSLTLAYSLAIKGYIEESRMSGGRTLKEVALYSPTWQGFFAWDPSVGKSQLVYFGYAVTILLAVALVFFVFRCFKSDKNKSASILVFGLSILAIVSLLWLSLGTHGPLKAKLFLAARKLIPHYNMIRQPAKIFCLLPTVLGVSFAIIFNETTTLWRPLLWVRALLTLLLLAGIAEYKFHVHATVCILDKEQWAYQAIVKDAGVNLNPPRALIVPLWPGDSSWASLYEYYSSLYKIRMVNGYSPVVSQKYFDTIFVRLNSVNQGFFSDAHADFLLSRGVEYLVFHEDAFPSKVSPFPAGFTLKQLMGNPRLHFLKQEEAVWAFKILRNPLDKIQKPSFSSWNRFFPSRFFEAENQDESADMIHEDNHCSNGKYLAMKAPEKTFQTKPVSIGEAPNLRWLIRMRGKGELKLTVLSEGTAVHQETFVQQEASVHQEAFWKLDSMVWEWKPLCVEGWNSHGPLSLKLQILSGDIDVDLCLLTAGEWKIDFPPSDPQTLLSPLFFHGGYTDPETSSVIFKKDRVHSDLREMDPVLYGPNLPLAIGKYKIIWDFKTEAPFGQRVGKIQLKSGDLVLLSRNIHAGQPLDCEIQIEQNLPFNCQFIFTNEGDVELKNCTLVRMS